MKPFISSAIMLLVLLACGKKPEPAPEPPPPATEAAPQAEQGPADSLPQATVEPPPPRVETAMPTDSKYVVAKGDNLYRIAKTHGLNQRDLAKWNKIKNPRRLRVGQELRLTAPGS